MDLFNIFYLDVKRRVESRDALSRGDKDRIISKVITNAEDSGIFKPIKSYLDEEDDTWDVEDDIEFEPLDREELVKEKQKELGIVAEEKEEKDLSPDLERQIGRWGRTRLHEAVLMGDEKSVRRYIGEGDDASMTDNNGDTPYDVAILHENEVLMKVFEELKAAF